MNKKARPVFSLAVRYGLGLLHHLLHVVVMMMVVMMRARVVAMMMMVTMLYHRGSVRARRADTGTVKAIAAASPRAERRVFFIGSFPFFRGHIKSGR
ncbi:hypothetical protein [Mesorhizobium sp. ES1-4]|uniref:hypothetical protein n=1 Tax=Mesorhizobium sp. ES1-4 TaxID=2876627 RepID=UPI001CCD03C9|nr:hypothetical protein [Mesorhizobium sp. ES1-4]MBZ9798178.1 hypothetical protein [Mesorhizobium sp. ES1-4]